MSSSLLDFKSKLQELTQKQWKKMPQYELLEESGPGHQKFFLVQVFWNQEKFFLGQAPSKKEAEQNAAKEALIYLEKRGFSE
jgi:ribonuclease-3